MLFFVFLESCCCTKFWKGSPLILNITVIFAAIILIVALILFLIHYYLGKRKLRREIKGKSIITNQSQDFNPYDDKDPNRPMAIIIIPTENETQFAGPIELFKKLPHVTREVINSFSSMERVDLFAEPAESEARVEESMERADIVTYSSDNENRDEESIERADIVTESSDNNNREEESIEREVGLTESSDNEIREVESMQREVIQAESSDD